MSCAVTEESLNTKRRAPHHDTHLGCEKAIETSSFPTAKWPQEQKYGSGSFHLWSMVRGETANRWKRNPPEEYDATRAHQEA